jgi:hypothetical protein
MQSRITPSNSSPWRTLRVLNVIILVAVLWYPAAASATDDVPGASMFSFSGFGTLGLVHSSEDRADFVANPLQANGAGYTRPWSPDVDSRLGVQVTAQFTPQLSAMLQVISEQNYDGTFTPHVEWANISYQPTPEFTVRVGRIVLPTFLLSDSRKLGYANPWVRPPIEVYDLSPIYDNDGVDASYKMHLGELVNTLVGSYGKNDFRVPLAGTLDDNHQWAIADTVEYDALTLHIAYLRSSITYRTLDAVFDVFRQFGPQGVALAEQYNLDNKLGQQITAGAMYDPGQWFMMGEWGERILHSAIVDSTAWYLGGGYRLAKFTPYLTYAQIKADSDTSSPGLTVSELPPYLAGPATELNAALNGILATNPIQKTISVGSRWDVMKNIDLKVQYDRIALGAGSAGTLSNAQLGFQPGGIVNLFSIAIDFVW